MAATAPAPTEDVPIELSPFTVTTDGDVGYIATNSLAGSRLNTALRDTPAVVDVFTPEFLLDLGATGLEDAMLYANNSQVDDGDGERVNNGLSQTEAAAPFNFRSRGILGNSTRNYFETRLSTDFYNVERLDDSRGPNSVLFGIGSAGGLVNNSPKRAQFGTRFVETQLRGGTQQQFRSTVDINLPVVAKRLSLRLNAIFEEKGSWREYVHKRRKAADLALTYRPTASTEIRIAAERGEVRATLARNFPTLDSVTRWWNAGSPVVAATSTSAPNAAQTAQGMTRYTTAKRYVFVENQGFAMNMANNWATVMDEPYAPWMLNDPARVPYEANVLGSGGRSLHDFENVTAIVEQRFTPSLVAELGFYHEAGKWQNYDHEGTNLTVFGDPNALLRNTNSVQPVAGSDFRPALDAAGNLVNPNAGGSYVETGWVRKNRRISSDNVRATLAYQHDAGRWGLHRLAGMAQRQVEKDTYIPEADLWLGAPFNSTVTHDNNQVWRRAYITLGDAASQRLPDPLNPSSAKLTVNDPVAGVITNGWVQDGGTKSRRTIESLMIAAQSTWWDKRIVTTFGFRQDDLEQRRTLPSRDRSGIWANSNGVQVFDGNSPSEIYTFTGRTSTAGIVYHPLRWFSAFANMSKNLGLPNFTQRVGVEGDVPPAPEGRGSDYGIWLNLFNDRIVIRASHFTAISTDQIGAMGVTTFSPAYNNMIAVLMDPNGDGNTADRLFTSEQMAAYSELRPTSASNADSLDSENRGYEFRITANVSESLRFIVNYAYSQQERTNVYKYTTVLYDQFEQFLADVQRTNPGVDVYAQRGTLGRPVGEHYTTTRNDLEGRKLDFMGAFGNRKHKANSFVNYSVKRGPLAGWSAGFGVRYLGPIYAGRVATPPGEPPRISQMSVGVGANGPAVYGSDSLQFDGMLRYHWRLSLLGRNTRASFQLNIRNLTDDTDIEIRRYKTDGVTLDRFALREPREIIVSTTLKF